MASGVTVHASRRARLCQASQLLVTIPESHSHLESDSQDLGGFRRRFGTPVVRSTRIEIGRVIPLMVREVASALRLTPATVYAAVAKGRIPHIRVGHALRIPVRPTA